MSPHFELPGAAIARPSQYTVRFFSVSPPSSYLRLPLVERRRYCCVYHIAITLNTPASAHITERNHVTPVCLVVVLVRYAQQEETGHKNRLVQLVIRRSYGAPRIPVGSLATPPSTQTESTGTADRLALRPCGTARCARDSSGTLELAPATARCPRIALQRPQAWRDPAAHAIHRPSWRTAGRESDDEARRERVASGEARRLLRCPPSRDSPGPHVTVAYAPATGVRPVPLPRCPARGRSPLRLFLADAMAPRHVPPLVSEAAAPGAGPTAGSPPPPTLVAVPPALTQHNTAPLVYCRYSNLSSTLDHCSWLAGS
jgi:hypothetical protein